MSFLASRRRTRAGKILETMVRRAILRATETLARKEGPHDNADDGARDGSAPRAWARTSTEPRSRDPRAGRGAGDRTLRLHADLARHAGTIRPLKCRCRNPRLEQLPRLPSGGPPRRVRAGRPRPRLAAPDRKSVV